MSWKGNISQQNDPILLPPEPILIFRRSLVAISQTFTGARGQESRLDIGEISRGFNTKIFSTNWQNPKKRGEVYDQKFMIKNLRS